MTAEQLKEIYIALYACRELIDAAPERFESSAGGHLAQMDGDAILQAASVVHRLMLWVQHPSVSPESYLGPLYSVKV